MQYSSTSPGLPLLLLPAAAPAVMFCTVLVALSLAYGLTQAFTARTLKPWSSVVPLAAPLNTTDMLMMAVTPAGRVTKLRSLGYVPL